MTRLCQESSGRVPVSRPIADVRQHIEPWASPAAGTSVHHVRATTGYAGDGDTTAHAAVPLSYSWDHCPTRGWGWRQPRASPQPNKLPPVFVHCPSTHVSSSHFPTPTESPSCLHGKAYCVYLETFCLQHLSPSRGKKKKRKKMCLKPD